MILNCYIMHTYTILSYLSYPVAMFKTTFFSVTLMYLILCEFILTWCELPLILLYAHICVTGQNYF